MNLPTTPLPIAITMGCPVGIGPEIIIRFLASGAPAGKPSPVVVGELGVLRRVAGQLGSAVSFAAWQPGEPLPVDRVAVLSLSDLGDGLVWGHPTPETGRAMGRYIEETVRLIQAGVFGGMVTCPIGKAALNAGGYAFPGHTEMLAALCHTDGYAMMMAGSSLRVTLVTIHQALASVAQNISEAAVLRMIRITAIALRDDFGITAPRLAVAGLNPHAGEGGMFGDEEARAIVPAIAAAGQEGWRVEGPFPPDTVFHKAAGGAFDAVVCMYHDQGLIPFKLLHFSDGVNVTLGLPIVRTSVDHGTAYDIAGTGKADPASLAAAFDLAALIAANRRAAGNSEEKNR
ncbi:MAG: 4-hydroxythreonine-4-phosphate dehydrogenase PdxA [Thermodesulfobacteriota bacterium]